MLTRPTIRETVPESTRLGAAAGLPAGSPAVYSGARAVRLLQNLLLALASLLVFLGVTEGLARLRYRPERIRYEGIFEYDRDKVWALKPDLTDGTFVGVPVRTNSLGHRDREIPRRKPAGGFRVVAVGDSVTFGHGVAAEDAWPERLERRLAARHPRRTIDVVNTAVPGNSPFQEYVDLERALALEPDAAVIQFVLNDVVEPYRVVRRYGGEGRDYHGVDDVPYWDWLLSQHSAFYLFLKDVAARLRFGALTAGGVREQALRQEAKLSWNAGADEPADPRMVEAWRECLGWMQREIDLCRRHGVRVVLLATPVDFQLEDGSRTYAQKRLAEFAARNGVVYVDLLTTLRERAAAIRAPTVADALRAVWRQHFLDHDHLTPAGHELVAEILEPLLDPGPAAQ
jgi:lysophospholipase L1-like esterase